MQCEHSGDVMCDLCGEQVRESVKLWRGPPDTLQAEALHRGTLHLNLSGEMCLESGHCVSAIGCCMLTHSRLWDILCHHPYHQRAEKGNIRAETVISIYCLELQMLISQLVFDQFFFFFF